MDHADWYGTCAEKLSYCKHCKFYDAEVREDKRRKVFFVECKTCGARGPVAPNKEKAKQRWGTVPIC